MPTLQNTFSCALLVRSYSDGQAPRVPPRYGLSDTWYAGVENLEQVRDHGCLWPTRLRRDRVSRPDDRRSRLLHEVAVSACGAVVHLSAYGLVRVIRGVEADLGVERCRARPSRSQRNHTGMTLHVFLRPV
jgi:hypothetical protein